MHDHTHTHDHHKHRYPAWQLRDLMRVHHTAMGRHLHKQGIRQSGQSIILVLLARENIRDLSSQKTLADMAGITPAGVTAALRSLELHGLIVRAENPDDSRRKQITVTEKGKEQLQKCREAARQVNELMLEGFTPEELEVFSGYVARMRKNLGSVLSAEGGMKP